MNPLVSWHSGHTESGRYYFRLEALGAEATHIVHAALFLARGEDDRFVGVWVRELPIFIMVNSMKLHLFFETR